MFEQTVGGEPELSEHIGLSQETRSSKVVTSLTMSAGQKLHDGGSGSDQEKKAQKKSLETLGGI